MTAAISLVAMAAWIALFGCTPRPSNVSVGTAGDGVELNDIHSQMNATRHRAVITPTTIAEIQTAIRDARSRGQFISISGGKHSMGGQQFGNGTINLSMSAFHQVIGLDSGQGIVEVQSGIQWPELVDWLSTHQRGSVTQWGIRQKQTGADRLSIGGALSSNIHGRGLTMRPMIDDVE